MRAVIGAEERFFEHRHAWLATSFVTDLVADRTFAR
jgi:hypothetical protein